MFDQRSAVHQQFVGPQVFDEIVLRIQVHYECILGEINDFLSIIQNPDNYRFR